MLDARSDMKLSDAWRASDWSDAARMFAVRKFQNLISSHPEPQVTWQNFSPELLEDFACWSTEGRRGAGGCYSTGDESRRDSAGANKEHKSISTIRMRSWKEVNEGRNVIQQDKIGQHWNTKLRSRPKKETLSERGARHSQPRSNVKYQQIADNISGDCFIVYTTFWIKMIGMGGGVQIGSTLHCGH
jgi:hypothetical protein